MTDDKQAEIDLMKSMVDKIGALEQRIASLEQNNNILTKSLEDPEVMMKKAGWMKFTTPVADEAFDPLQRDTGDQSFDSPFKGSGDVFQKSRFDELEEWKAAERSVTKQ